MAQRFGTTVICRCEQVDQATIEAAIRDGAVTCSGVKRRTRAGMGICQGRTCQPLVARLLCQSTGRSLAEVGDSTSRIPVRPVPVGAWGGMLGDRGDR